ncbi:hypothetical protein BLX88_10490, partial [Bacillus obstructivus]
MSEFVSKNFWWIIFGLFIFSIIIERIEKRTKRKKTRKKKSTTTARKTKATPKPVQTNRVRPDEVLLKMPLSDLNGFEFERLLALYFRDLGYNVEEVGKDMLQK